MDVELKNFFKVWVSVIISLCYCYFLVKRIRPGMLRLISLLPIVHLFITLPLSLFSIHLGGATAFYLVWLGNFKLFLFAFNRGPLSSQATQLSFLCFVSVAVFPIKTRTVQSPSHPENGEKKFESSLSDLYKQRSKIFRSAVVATKVVLLAIIVSLHRHREDFHPCLIMALYCFHGYLGIEMLLAISAVAVRAILGLEIEPQFNEPYLSTSLQDFWGRRWNLMVSSILRPTVYIPIRNLSTRVLGRNYNLIPAVMATFLVSGLMHEILYYYVTRASPTWEVTSFFILHGVAMVCEITLKKALNGRWRMHRAVSGLLTLGFVAITGDCLFFPQLLRNGVDQKAINEYYILVHFVRDRFTS